MKDKCYRLRKLKCKLRILQERGKEYVQWRLAQEQLEYLQKYFCIKPYLYTIKTRSFSKIRNINDTILKDIHYANKRGKKEIVRYLSNKERIILEKNGIRYKVCKYIIYLHS